MEVWWAATFITDGITHADEGELVVVDGVRPWDALPVCAREFVEMLAACRRERHPLAVCTVKITRQLVMACFGRGGSVAAQVVADPGKGFSPAFSGFGLRMVVAVAIVVIDTGC